MNSVIPVNGERLDLRDVDYVIVHRDVVGEDSGSEPELIDVRTPNEEVTDGKQIAIFRRKGWRRWPAARYQYEGRRALREAAADSRLRRVYEDERIVAFATDRRTR